MVKANDDPAVKPAAKAPKLNPGEFEVTLCDDCMLFTGQDPCNAVYVMKPAGLYRQLNGDIPRVEFCSEECRLESVKYRHGDEDITFRPQRVVVTRR